ncbi:MAG: efflux RND transporter periplasmic adaptor subunit [Planctomycetales bacterium]|nr:efflux RND transporter periplasmic adaptor subunit [Planctomycetales bacterium]
MSEAGLPRADRRWLSVTFNTTACLAILAASAAGIWLVYRTEPTAQQIENKRKSAALVETLTVIRDTYSPSVVALGTVQPAQDIVLSPRVRGQVLTVSPSFVPGGMVRQGEILLQIDPADFENAVSIRKSELEQVEASWRIEEGRQKLAIQELQLLGDSIDEVNRALVLREPQAASIKSQLNAARAAVERAELDLERTRLNAPFDAQILSRTVDVGSQVQPGDNLGQLVGIQEYWVIVTVPVRNLRWVQFANDRHEGSLVTLHNPEAWGSQVIRQGRVANMIGALDEQTRLARVLVKVNDPLGRKSDVPPLILDTLIEARIIGIPIADVVRLKREYVHDSDSVWVMRDGKLEIRRTEVVHRDPEFAYIQNGLDSGDEVVITTLATVADGVMLRKVNLDAAKNDASSSGDSAWTGGAGG